MIRIVSAALRLTYCKCVRGIPKYMNDTDVERTSVSGFKFTKCFDL
jgi:hypothetical protein